MILPALPELLDQLSAPIYGPYAYARSLIGAGDTVLDVGCGNGKVSAYLAESGATVDGVEPSSSRSSVAAHRVRTLSVLPIEANDPLLDEAYDLVTFFDVLEHLVEPASALRWAAGRLKPGGRVLAAIPNSAHWSFRRQILGGSWQMADSGLFDRTHVRFFDPETMRALQPEGTAELACRYFTPARGRVASILLGRAPALFALHVVYVWGSPPADRFRSQAKASR